MRDELVGLNKNKTWGGLSEHAVYDFTKSCWTRGHRNIALFFAAIEIRDGVWTTQPMAQAVLYEPGDRDGDGYVCSLNLLKQTVLWWKLTEIIRPVHTPSEEFMAVWRGWRPATATIGFEFVDSSRGDLAGAAPKMRARICRSLDWNEMKYLYFECNEQRIEWRLEKAFQEKLSRHVCELNGVIYDPKTL